MSVLKMTDCFIKRIKKSCCCFSYVKFYLQKESNLNMFKKSVAVGDISNFQ